MNRTTFILRRTLVAGALLALAAPASAAFQQAAAQDMRTLSVQQSERYGRYLIDDQGRALYLFTKDTRGQGSEKAASACHGACIIAWPPVSVSGQVQATGGVKGRLLSTITRKDGTKQVTYNGWPLYYWVQDRGGEEASGQDMHDFGGEWYLVTPEGEKLEAEPEDAGSPS